jgi:hypothetical protein
MNLLSAESPAWAPLGTRLVGAAKDMFEKKLFFQREKEKSGKKDKKTPALSDSTFYR